MTETVRLTLPLLQPAQAQKHVTVNEALLKLDGLAQLRLAALDVAVPPASVEGEAYAVPAGASADWAGKDGQIAIEAGGGWIFVTPETGWRAWIIPDAREAVWTGSEWVAGSLGVSASGAAAGFRTVTFDHVITPGATNVAAEGLPANAMVFAVSARVTQDITGSLTSWQMGLSAEPSKFGSGMGLLQGSFATGILSQPTTYYTPESVLLSAVGGDFAGGRLRVAMHYAEFALPED
ncbi:MAG: DUF2793 domain-containing protein [Planctomycetota bacterium]